ncbi:UNKNOWN [Stylonychia lemnae]|uniref:Uncharacterized protein n=1 Tax=Stylonychia lemnae TaxID=5949 RepID=A0A077ZV69_STYLE|nr:UNKNOWN [Stylonychia lemnae]|eukprot:CDW73784.1 UNKNOWN [Stylonychia lemnae]
MMYEDTSLNSGTRYQQKLKFKKEQINKLQGQILDYQKSNLRKSISATLRIQKQLPQQKFNHLCEDGLLDLDINRYLKIIRDIRRDERFSKIQEMIDKKWLIKLFEDFRKYDRLKILKQEKKRQLQQRQDRLSKLAQPKSPTAKVISFKTGSHGGTLEIPGTPHAHKKSIIIIKIVLMLLNIGLQSKNQISFGGQPQSCPPSPRSNRITMGQQYVVDSMKYANTQSINFCSKENKKLQDQILDLTNKILKKKGLIIKAKRLHLPCLLLNCNKFNSRNKKYQRLITAQQVVKISSLEDQVQQKKKKKAFISQYKEVFFKKIARKPKKHVTNKFLDDNLELDKFSQIGLNESKGQIDNEEEISPYELSS